MFYHTFAFVNTTKKQLFEKDTKILKKLKINENEGRATRVADIHLLITLK